MNTLIIVAFHLWHTLASPLAPPASENAYLDPGSGSFILQIAIAALLGALFILKGYWRKIIGFFRKPKAADQDEKEEE